MKKLKDMMNLKIIYRLIFSVVLILSFFVSIKININTHIYHDEFVYSTIYGTCEKVNSIKDIFISLKNLYLAHNGRFITHCILMFLLQTPKLFRDIFNGFLVLLLMFELVTFSKSKGKYSFTNILLILLVFPLLWTTIPAYGETIVWFVGSINYLLTTIILLAYLKLINKIFVSEDKLDKKHLIIYRMLSILVGSLHETIGCITIAYIALISLYLLIKNKKLNKDLLILGICLIFGFATIIFAPGTNIRKIATIQGMESVPTNIERLKTTVFMILNTIKKIPVISSILTIYCIISLIRIKYTIKEKESVSNLFLIISALFTYFAMVMSPTFLERVTFMPYIIMVFVFFKIMNIDINLKYFNKLKNVGIIVATIVLCIMSFDSINETFDLTKQLNIAWQKRDEDIANQVAEGQKNIYVDPLGCKFNSHMYGGELSTSLSSNHNGSMSAYYQIDSIRLNSEYYCDLKLSNVNKENADSISLNADNYCEEAKFYLLDKEVYEKQAPYKKYKNSYLGGDIKLYFAMPTINNLGIQFSKNEEITIENIKIYTKDNTILEKNGKNILESVNLENIEVKEFSDDKIVLKVNAGGRISFSINEI